MEPTPAFVCVFEAPFHANEAKKGGQDEENGTIHILMSAATRIILQLLSIKSGVERAIECDLRRNRHPGDESVPDFLSRKS